MLQTKTNHTSTYYPYTFQTNKQPETRSNRLLTYQYDQQSHYILHSKFASFQLPNQPQTKYVALHPLRLPIINQITLD